MVEVESKKEANDYLRPPVSYGPHFKVKGAVLNMWGVTYALSLLLNSVLLLPSLFMLTIVSDISGDTKVSDDFTWVFRSHFAVVRCILLCILTGNTLRAIAFLN